MDNMFCFQCQETAKGSGCTVKGVCGKDASTANMMDLLLYVVKGISITTTILRKKRVEIPSSVNYYVVEALFSTITNANFDYESIKKRVKEGIVLRNQMLKSARDQNISIPLVDEVIWNEEESHFDRKAKEVGVLKEKEEDIRSLKELIVYGIKGMAAYTEHAMHIGYDDVSIHQFIQETFYELCLSSLSAEELTGKVLEVGEYGVKSMALLDKANTESYGHPEITKVSLEVRKNPAILITGHDLRDLEELLIQTKGTGVDVYTHSEMLPANSYPAFKKYDNFVGNYGSSWWHQRDDFENFNGPILFTTNCIVPPLSSASYNNRVYTTNATGFPGWKHIKTLSNGKKDFTAIIAQAQTLPSPKAVEHGEIIAGFAHHQVGELIDNVAEAIRKGDIKKFVVMGGCDGRMKNREYYTEFAKKLPKDTVILTAGCAKFRYNKLPLGDINGIPRVLDAGQCNDSYSIALIAMKLKEVFQLSDINELPVVYNIAWYEQKAVIVLLALLSLGVKNIHLGPTLPAFVSPNVLKVLIDKFNVGTITNVDDDIRSMMN